MKQNPHIYALFSKFALERAQKGKPFGMKALAERVRWECSVYGNEDFKINNNYVTYIGRRLVREFPRLKNYIELRKTKY